MQLYTVYTSNGPVPLLLGPRQHTVKTCVSSRGEKLPKTDAKNVENPISTKLIQVTARYEGLVEKLSRVASANRSCTSSN